MRAIAAALTLFLCCAAQAAGDTYAVVSLVGDGLLVVAHRASTGTSFAGNVREFVTASDTALDRSALIAADDALRSAIPGARGVLLGGRDPAAVEAQSKAPGQAGTMQAIADALRAKLPATGADWLIIVAKGQHAAQFSPDVDSNTHVGTGTVEGLGYYLDREYRVSKGNGTRDASPGFLGAFAAIDVGLVDLRTGKVVAERDGWQALVVHESDSPTLSPWDALTPERKIAIVNGLLKDELARSIPALLASR